MLFLLETEKQICGLLSIDISEDLQQSSFAGMLKGCTKQWKDSLLT